MWPILLAVLVAAGVVHGLWTRKRGNGRVPEMILIYLLAGYCGIMQILVGGAAIVNPDWVATHMAGVPPGNPVMVWAGFLFLGLGVIATMSVRFRGEFLLGPVIAWSIFWLGATYAHVVADTTRGAHLTHGSFLQIFVAHGLVGVLLIAACIWWLIAKAPDRAAASQHS